MPNRKGAWATMSKLVLILVYDVLVLAVVGCAVRSLILCPYDSIHGCYPFSLHSLLLSRPPRAHCLIVSPAFCARIHKWLPTDTRTFSLRARLIVACRYSVIAIALAAVSSLCFIAARNYYESTGLVYASCFCGAASVFALIFAAFMTIGDVFKF